jgi:predicted secreted hydrolase
MTVRRALIGLVLLAVAVLAYVLWPSRNAAPRRDDVLDVTAMLGEADTSGYARAMEPRRFVFPRDHGPHPEYRTEWWYYTGNLVSHSGDRYGFQLTFFRSALQADSVGGTSPWRTRQAYMAHFAVTDVSAGEFQAFERFERGAKGLAGAQAQPFRVWLDDWSARGDTTGATVLHASDDGVALRLRAVPVKPIVLQGDDGLSRKGAAPGNASYYYSLTRLRADGVLVLDGDSAAVSGTAWLDREWSTSALESGQVGWDWFALQLADTTELMYYRIRRADGSADPHSRGVLVRADGTRVTLARDDVELLVTGSWRSPRGTSYPSGWRLRASREPVDLSIEPLVRDQEIDLSFRYWEGAVRVRGTSGGREVEGYGYVELTGYAR